MARSITGAAPPGPLAGRGQRAGAYTGLCAIDRAQRQVADGHELPAWIVAGLALVHVAGVFATRRRERETPVAAMIVGSKRAPAEGNVECVETRPQ